MLHISVKSRKMALLMWYNVIQATYQGGVRPSGEVWDLNWHPSHHRHRVITCFSVDADHNSSKKDWSGILKIHHYKCVLNVPELGKGGLHVNV